MLTRWWRLTRRFVVHPFFAHPIPAGVIVLLLAVIAAGLWPGFSGSDDQANYDGLFELVLSGGESPAITMRVDDDIQVWLNDEIIYTDGDSRADVPLPPMKPFRARNGDRLRIVALDTAACRYLSPIYLHRLKDGFTQILTPGVQAACDWATGGRPFFDETYEIVDGKAISFSPARLTSR